MNAAELTGSLAHLGINKSEAARLLGVTYRTVHRWSEGEQEIPQAVAQTLRLRLVIDHAKEELENEDWWHDPSHRLYPLRFILEDAASTGSQFKNGSIAP